MRVLLFFIIMFNFMYASTEILKDKCLKVSVSQDGSLGDARIPPGIQFDKECKGNFSDTRDYLTPATPYEYYSLKYNTSTYYANNGVDNNAKKAIKGLKEFSIDKNSSGIYTAVFTKDGKFKIEHKYSLEKEKLNITTKITNLTENILQNIYFSRGLDPDIDVGEHDDTKTENIRGYNGSNPKDFIYSKGAKTGLPIGLYSISEVLHNTSLFPFGHEQQTSMDAEALFNGVKAGKKIDDSIINIAFKIEQLQPNETKKLEYKYMCSSNIDKSVSIKSLVMDGDKDIFSITSTKSGEYELVESIPSFRVNSNSISSIGFPMTVHGIPNGVQIRMAGKIFDKDKNANEINLNCNQDYNVKVFRNRNFKEESQFNIDFKAGEILDNVAQWFGNDEFTLKFKPQITEGGIKVSENNINIPYKWTKSYEEVDTGLFTLVNDNKEKTIDNNMSIELKDIPNGIKIVIEGKEFTKESPKVDSILIDSDKKYTIKIFRNGDFKEKNEFKINFHGESHDRLILNKKDFAYSFKPIPRKLFLKASTSELTMPLNKLDGVVYFTIFDGDRKIIGEELKELKLTTNLKLDNYEIVPKKESIELKFIPEESFCLPPNIDIGENRVSFTVTTPYPNESQTKSIKIEIEDIEFWEKWGCLILLSLGLLFLLILIYGYLKKKRFCKNSHFKIEKDGRKPSTSYFKSKVSFISKLIPFKDERVSIEAITFVAGGGCRVIIPKSSQGKKLNINGDELEDMAGKRDITMVGGDEIFSRNKVMRFY